MFIKKVFIKNYRNITQSKLNLNTSLNIFLGNNGQGKTNFLEAVYLLGTTSSHRTNTDKELIKWGNKKSFVQALLERKDQELKIALNINSNKKAYINNTPLEKISELMGNLNVVLFSPEDLYLIKGGPSYRRKFIDIEVSQVSPYYHHLIQEYNHILKQRNNQLKEIRDTRGNKNLLELWDEKLIKIGSKIIKKRLEVIKKLKILARLSQRQITDGSENLRLEYESSIGVNMEDEEKRIRVIFKQNIVNNRDSEIKRGYTLIGPHRDDLLLEVNDIDVRKFGSQGQQRTSALALKLSELEFMKSETGEYPVLLLDDVFSELDSFRRKKLVSVIAGKIQTFITATDMDSLDDLNLESFNIYNVRGGNILKEKGEEN